MRPVLFATHRPPWPLDNGARIRAARLAQALSRQTELTLVTFANGPVYDETVARREDLELLLPSGRVELVPYGRARPAGARRGVLKPASAAWGTYSTPTLRYALQALLAAQPQAILHLDMPGVALAGLGLAPGRTVYSSHNVEYRIWREVLVRRPWTHRPFLQVEWRKVAAEERRCWRHSDLCLAVSEIDAATMRDGGAQRVEVVPNGADPHDPLPPAPLHPDGPVRLLFVGTGAYWPYEHGLAWFGREVMPLLRERHPVVFDVVGDPPLQPVHGEGIHYHGRVGDLRPFYEAAHAAVVPVFEGSGTRLKVIEAALLGRPVISTGLGAEGLPIEPGRHYVRAETAAEWVEAIARLRRGELAGLVPGARAALEQLTWSRIGATLVDLYAAL